MIIAVIGTCWSEIKGVSEMLRDYLFCSKPGIIVRAQDITSTVKEIMEAAREIGNRPFYMWDANEGLRQVIDPDDLFITKGNRDNTTAPVQALQKASATKDAIAVFLDFHHYLTSPPVLSAMRTALAVAEKHGASLVFVSEDHKRTEAPGCSPVGHTGICRAGPLIERRGRAG